MMLPVIVLVRERLCIDTIDGRVDRGGEGKHDWDMSMEVRELMIAEVGAMEGDCRGDWMGSSFLHISRSTGGNNGVVACRCSSSPSSCFCSMGAGSVGSSSEV